MIVTAKEGERGDDMQRMTASRIQTRVGCGKAFIHGRTLYQVSYTTSDWFNVKDYSNQEPFLCTVYYFSVISKNRFCI